MAARAQVEKLRPPAPPRGGFARRQAEPTPELKRAEEYLQQSEAQVAALQGRSPDFAHFVADKPSRSE